MYESVTAAKPEIKCELKTKLSSRMMYDGHGRIWKEVGRTLNYQCMTKT